MRAIVNEPEQMDAAAKADVLIESLNWVKRYAGETVVVKFGGNAMVDEDLARAFAADMVYLRSVGVRVVVVHGGGPQITAELERRGIPTRFAGGYRVTTPEAVEVVHDVLTQEVTAKLVALIDEHGEGAAAAVDGKNVFFAIPKTVVVDGEPIDLGRVGEIDEFDRHPFLDLLGEGVIPVVSTIAEHLDEPGTLLNVNADAAAGWVAHMLGAKKLVMLTDVAGLYRDWPDPSTVIEQLTASELEQLLPTLQSGMIPKMTACLDALRNGAGAATIIDGRVPHAILLEIFTKRGSGTEIVPDERRHDA